METLLVGGEIDASFHQDIFQYLKTLPHGWLKTADRGFCDVSDVRMARDIDEDSILAKNTLLRLRLRRGFSYSFNGDLKIIIKRGLPKFYDFSTSRVTKIENDVAETFENQLRVLDKIRISSKTPPTIRIQALEKINGQNAQVSFCRPHLQWVCASKNVSVFLDPTDGKIQSDSNRSSTTTACRIAQIWYRIVCGMASSDVDILIDILQSGTLIGELVLKDANNCRILPREVKEDCILFYAFVQNENREESLSLCEVLSSNSRLKNISGLMIVKPTLDYTCSLCPKQVMEIMTQISSSAFTSNTIEGFVTYLSLCDSDSGPDHSKVWAIFKHKSNIYTILRHLRESVKTVVSESISLEDFDSRIAKSTFDYQSYEGFHIDLIGELRGFLDSREFEPNLRIRVRDLIDTCFQDIVGTKGKRSIRAYLEEYGAGSLSSASLCITSAETRDSGYVMDPLCLNILTNQLSYSATELEFFAIKMRLDHIQMLSLKDSMKKKNRRARILTFDNNPFSFFHQLKKIHKSELEIKFLRARSFDCLENPRAIKRILFVDYCRRHVTDLSVVRVLPSGRDTKPDFYRFSRQSGSFNRVIVDTFRSDRDSSKTFLYYICEYGCCFVLYLNTASELTVMSKLIDQEFFRVDKTMNMPTGLWTARNKISVFSLLCLGFPGCGKTAIFRSQISRILKCMLELGPVYHVVSEEDFVEVQIKEDVIWSDLPNRGCFMFRGLNPWKKKSASVDNDTNHVLVCYTSSDLCNRQFWKGRKYDPVENTIEDFKFRTIQRNAKANLETAISEHFIHALSRGMDIVQVIDKIQTPPHLGRFLHKLHSAYENLILRSDFETKAALLIPAPSVCSILPANLICPGCQTVSSVNKEVGIGCILPVDPELRSSENISQSITPNQLNRYIFEISAILENNPPDFEYPFVYSINTIIEAALRLIERPKHPTLKQDARTLQILFHFLSNHTRAKWLEFGLKPYISQHEKKQWEYPGVIKLYKHKIHKVFPVSCTICPFFIWETHPDIFRECSRLIFQIANLATEDGDLLYQDLFDKIRQLSELIAADPNLASKRANRIETESDEATSMFDEWMTQCFNPQTDETIRLNQAAEVEALLSLNNIPLYVAVDVNTPVHKFNQAFDLRWLKSTLTAAVAKTWPEQITSKMLQQQIRQFDAYQARPYHVTIRSFNTMDTRLKREQYEFVKNLIPRFGEVADFRITHIAFVCSGLITASVIPETNNSILELVWFDNQNSTRGAYFPHVTIYYNRKIHPPRQSNTLLQGIDNMMSVAELPRALPNRECDTYYKLDFGDQPYIGLEIPDDARKNVESITFLPRVGLEFSNVFLIKFLYGVSNLNLTGGTFMAKFIDSASTQGNFRQTSNYVGNDRMANLEVCRQ